MERGAGAGEGPGGGPGLPEPGAAPVLDPRGRAMDVESHREGRLRLAGPCGAVAVAVAVAGLLVAYEAGQRGYEDKDARYGIWDHRVTRAGKERANAFLEAAGAGWGPAAGSAAAAAAAAPGVPVVQACVEGGGGCARTLRVRCDAGLAQASAARYWDAAAGALRDGEAPVHASCGALLRAAGSWKHLKQPRLLAAHRLVEGTDPPAAFMAPGPEPTQAETDFWGEWLCRRWGAVAGAGQVCVVGVDACGLLRDTAGYAPAGGAAAWSGPAKVVFEASAGACPAGVSPTLRLFANAAGGALGAPAAAADLADAAHPDELLARAAAVGAAYEAAFPAFAPPLPAGPVAAAVSVAGAPVALEARRAAGPDVASFVGIADLWLHGQCPGTGFRRYALAGAGAYAFPAFSWDRAALVPVGFLGDVAHVPAYRSASDFDAGTAAVARLTAVTVKVAATGLGPRPWRLAEVTPEYSPAWAGPVAEAELGAAAPGTPETIAVELVTASAPKKLDFPALHSETFLLAALGLGGFALFYFLFLLYLYFLVHKHARMNQGLPPPFFRYRVEFRGW